MLAQPACVAQPSATGLRAEEIDDVAM